MSNSFSQHLKASTSPTGITNEPPPSGDLAVAPPAAGPRRLWIPAIFLALGLACVAIPQFVEFENINIMFGLLMIGPLVSSGGVLVWWLLLSGLTWRDRLLGLLFVGAAAGLALGLSHPTFRVALMFYGLVGLVVVWVGYLLLTGWLNWPARRIGLALTLLLAAGACTLFRMDGTTGTFGLELSFRFNETAEERYLKGLAAGGVAATNSAQVRLSPGDWPGFRGPARDGRVTGISVPTDWDKNPPKRLWERSIGPGWSSFAVVGNRLYTQEQRGPNEVVVCLDAADEGKQLWEHADEARFTEPIAGAGPRATPTFHEGKIYALGAKGNLNCLDAATGKKVWGRDIVEDSGSKPAPGGWWGYSSSPLVARGVVTVVASFTSGKCVLGYKADTGDLVWSAGDGKNSYSSTHLVTLGGTEQILAPADDGLTSLDPATGKVLWHHEWKTAQDMPRCTQPAVLGEGDFLLGSGLKDGSRRLHVRPSGDGMATEEVWTTKAISPYFNDLVVHKGHIYGFDTGFFTCVDLEKGERGWRARGYGQGQVLLLADQGLLLVISEKGEVSLVKADPEKHVVLGKFQALKGKTWNHPVVAHGKLFVRNGEQVACYQLVPDESSGEAK